MNPSTARLGIFAALALLMAATRVNHFAMVPDASWAVFFAAGYYLRGQWRWAFPLLMVLAVAVDFVVITRSGMNFWTHYCVSPGYWFLLPAYFSLWAAGAWFATRGEAALPRRFGQLVLALVGGVVVCHAFAQGGFYWFSNAVAAPSIGGWLTNYGHWLLPYLQTAAIWTAAIVATDRGLAAMRGADAVSARSRLPR